MIMEASKSDPAIAGIQSLLAGLGRSHTIAGAGSLGATPDAERLLAYNGYYSLDGAPGGFFAVDANIHVVNASGTITLSVNLLICLDGKTSTTIPFTGSFDGTRLIQRVGSLEIALEFRRPASGSCATASVSGAIIFHLAARRQVSISISGSTFNNPIPMHLFAGTYYLPGAASKEPVASIAGGPGDWVSIKYDWGTGSGILTQVTEFTYNCNMYYFTLVDSEHPLGPTSPKLIMGTASGQGLACQNIDGLTSRDLRTIPSAKPSNQPTSAPGAQDLASFSGYYALNSIASGAFVSIGGQYVCLSGTIACYQVLIAYSLDGINSTSYYYDTSMSFDPATGILTAPGLSVSFTRVYDPNNGTLASVSGTVAGHSTNGQTYFNPVPLSAFGPAKMTAKAGPLSVQVESDTSVVYVDQTGKTTTLTNFIYVPLMYIVGTTLNSKEFILSLGTDGSKGLACIVMSMGSLLGAVWSLPDAGS
jgi:hypothetical protein